MTYICRSIMMYHIRGQAARVETRFAEATPTNLRAKVMSVMRRAAKSSTATTGIKRYNAAGNAKNSIGTPALAKKTGTCTMRPNETELSHRSESEAALQLRVH